MVDFIYIAGTLAFFTLMIAYVHACDRLGRSRDAQHAAAETWQAPGDKRP